MTQAGRRTGWRTAWAVYLATSIGVWSAVAIAVADESLSGGERPNIVLFLVDDMGLMDTSVAFLTDAAGKPQRYPLNDFYRTPAMERLAERGVRFSNFYAMSVCSPTRTSIQTGQNSARHHVTNWINPRSNNRGPLGAPEWRWRGLDRKSTTLARLLQKSGYRTLHVGKGHFGPEETDGADPTTIGFDVNVGGRSVGQPGSYYGKQNYGAGGKRSPNAVPHLEAYHGTDTFLTEALTFEANRLMGDSLEQRRPFFLYLAHYAVHAPFESDARFAAHYRDSGKPPAAQAFATLIEGMDKSLGDLLDFLEARGAAENTLVLFLGDNGSDAPLGGPHDVGSSAPLRGRKGSHFEGGMRVPMIAAWAKPNANARCQQRLPIASGLVRREIAAVYDLFPTILNAAGVEAPSDHAVDGVDLSPLLASAAGSRPESTFLMHYPHAPHRSDYFTVYREGRWKLVLHYEPASEPWTPRYELYDLETDPFESRNSAADHPEQVDRLAAAMRERLQAQEAQFPVDKQGQELVPIP